MGGGSVANLLAVWRVHGLDDVFRTAWERGIVLAGVSAGSICWHVGGTTDSFGPDLRLVDNGIPAVVRSVSYLGPSRSLRVDTETLGELALMIPGNAGSVADGDRVALAWSPADAWLVGAA